MILEVFSTRQIRPFMGLPFRMNSTSSHSGCAEEAGEGVDVVMQLCVEGRGRGRGRGRIHGIFIHEGVGDVPLLPAPEPDPQAAADDDPVGQHEPVYYYSLLQFTCGYIYQVFSQCQGYLIHSYTMIKRRSRKRWSLVNLADWWCSYNVLLAMMKSF